MTKRGEIPAILGTDALTEAQALIRELVPVKSGSEPAVAGKRAGKKRKTSASDVTPAATANSLLPEAEWLAQIMACSPFIARELKQDPQLLVRLGGAALEENYPPQVYRERAMALLPDVTETDADSESAFMESMRLFRRHEMVRIAWRDLSGLASTENTLHSLSDLADACIEAACRFAATVLQIRFGIPRDESGVEQQLIVICMGKLGGRELNFSSDIDLILTYASAGETDGKKSISNEEFFRKQAQLFFKLLNKTTEHGFVFRVDLRLRPFGDSGPVVMNFEGLEYYYLTQGREWERYAMIKARVLLANDAHRQVLMELLKPFIYRRYLDYGVFESLRELKLKIAAQLEKKGQQANIKTGYGGIREIEFVGQAFQLLRGGREPALQTRQIIPVLELLRELKLLPEGDVDSLLAAYDFLRRTENCLQMMTDEQVHVLPEAEAERCRLWYAMGFESEEPFFASLDTHRANVNRVFSELFSIETVDAADDEKTANDTAQHPAPTITLEKAGAGQRSTVAGEDRMEEYDLWSQFWSDLVLTRHPRDMQLHADSDGHQQAADTPQQQSGSEALSSVQALPFAEKFDDASLILEALGQLKSGVLYANLTPVAQKRVDQLVPLIVVSALAGDNPDDTLNRLLGLVRAVAGRSVYLQILLERPKALQLLVELFSRSSWIAEFVTQHPIVIDELLDYSHDEHLPDRESLQADMRFVLKRIDAEDLDVQMDAIRHFKQANVMRVAVAEVQGHLRLTEVSDCLSWIAEIALQAVCDLVSQDMLQRHGQPVCKIGKKVRKPEFAIVAYGKLGGAELTYASDLDIVFLHDSSGELQQSDGDKPLDSQVYFGRLAQKIVHFINTLTPAGVLYEIDTRLRPNGQSGLLVSSLTAFEQYQRENAWTWEHQALVRARVVVGSEATRSAFATIRSAVLADTRNESEVAEQVANMRDRMHAEFGLEKPGWFNLKHDRGGIADIEFMVQYTVLAYASKHPALLEYTDNLSILGAARKLSLIQGEHVESLETAYLEYRRYVHRAALQESKAVVADSETLAGLRGRVSEIWESVLGNRSTG